MARPGAGRPSNHDVDRWRHRWHGRHRKRNDEPKDGHRYRPCRRHGRGFGRAVVPSDSGIDLGKCRPRVWRSDMGRSNDSRDGLLHWHEHDIRNSVHSHDRSDGDHYVKPSSDPGRHRAELRRQYEQLRHRDFAHDRRRFYEASEHARYSLRPYRSRGRGSRHREINGRQYRPPRQARYQSGGSKQLLRISDASFPNQIGVSGLHRRRNDCPNVLPFEDHGHDSHADTGDDRLDIECCRCDPDFGSGRHVALSHNQRRLGCNRTVFR